MIAGLAHGQSGHERLAKFYADEFIKFNAAFVKHVDQLDLCLAEMDRFEIEFETWFEEPVECPRFDVMRPEGTALLEGVKPVMESYSDVLESGYAGSAYDRVAREMYEAVALLRVYGVKFQQAQIQTERIRKLESELGEAFQGLTDAVQEWLQLQHETETPAK